MRRKKLGAGLALVERYGNLQRPQLRRVEVELCDLVLLVNHPHHLVCHGLIPTALTHTCLYHGRWFRDAAGRCGTACLRRRHRYGGWEWRLGPKTRSIGKGRCQHILDRFRTPCQQGIDRCSLGQQVGWGHCGRNAARLKCERGLGQGRWSSCCFGTCQPGARGRLPVRHR